MPADNSVLITVGCSAATFFIGFIGARFWFTKKERKDFEQKNYENTLALVARHKEAYNKYVSAITAYCNSPAPSFDDFTAIATTGDVYFYEVGLACSSILSGKLDGELRDHDLLPKIKEVVWKTLPDHYSTLQHIAKAKGYPYHGQLRRENYSSIYAVAEKFGLEEPAP